MILLIHSIRRNSMTSQEVVDFIRERIQSKSLVAICDEVSMVIYV